MHNGMSDSLRLVLDELVNSNIEGDVVHWPIDHPLVTPEAFNAVSELSSAFLVRPKCGNQFGHPIYMSRQAVEAFRDDYSYQTLREFFEANSDNVVDVCADSSVLYNLNTVNEVSLALSYL